MSRTATINRKTKETAIDIQLDLDGAPAENVISTGLPFFDHMLNAMAKHGNFALKLQAVGDLEIDPHHTIEDTGLALGQAFNQALSDKRGISRFAEATVPLDEALARAVVDLSGRPHLSWRCQFPEASAGGISRQLFHEFFQAFVNTAAVTVHIDLIAGDENHHCIEAIFKAFGRSMRSAAAIDPALAGALPSTKGVL